MLYIEYKTVKRKEAECSQLLYGENEMFEYS